MDQETGVFSSKDAYLRSESAMDSELHALLGIDQYVMASYRVNAQVLINGGAEGIST